ncbi:MAG: sensor histidine kinase [Candidatus Sericytochromatia bacterium]|nr:MAG: sensor histidine kinase [Candidatus Sericytochromatia bacterium]
MFLDFILSIKDNINHNVYITDDIILRTIKNSIQFLSEFIPADIHIYKICGDLVTCIGEAKSSIYPSFYRRSHIDLTFNVSQNSILKKTLDEKKNVKGYQGEIYNNFPLYQYSYPILNSNSNIIGILLIERSIFETKKWLLRKWFYDELVEYLISTIIKKGLYEINYLPNFYPSDAIIIINNEGIINYSNNNAINIFSHLGLEIPLEGNRIQTIINFDKYNIINQEVNHLFYKQELIIGNNNIEINYIIVETYIILLIKNLTEIRKKEKEIKVKSVIINEINHRVKNNLQSITSLLRLQKRRIDNPEIKSIINDIINRINSISIVHEYLSYSDIDAVDISEVIKKIAEEIINSYSFLNKIIKLEFNFDDKLIISSHKAVSIALVVNEIIINSLKHAFEDINECIIFIEFKILNNKFILNITDNGKGFPENFDIKKNSNLGWNIIDIIIKDDLKGEYSIYKNTISIAINLDDLVPNII